MPSQLTHQKDRVQGVAVKVYFTSGDMALLPSSPAELSERDSLFHTCFPIEGTLICGQPHIWKCRGKDRASPVPATPTVLLQLHSAAGDNPFPHLPWDHPGPCSRASELLPTTSGAWALVEGKSNCRHAACFASLELHHPGEANDALAPKRSKRS